ncbi:MAG: WYL domain-containing protein [Microbacteriaceae bacterium]|nr:WYL domain-containing protein [Microbacteriaceae bacterium]
MAEPRRAPGQRPEPIEASDRLAFYLAFVPYLKEMEIVSVAEAAAHFGYSEAFVRETALNIMTLGLPGEEGLYLPQDLFDLDLNALEEEDELVLVQRVGIDDVPRMSAREAAGLLAGLSILGSDPAIAAVADFASLRAKLARGAADAPAEPVIASTTATVPGFTALRGAIAARRRVAFDYRNADGTTARREVDPIRLESTDAEHYLRGWCLLRAGLRTFRLDRISALEVLEAPAEHDVRDLDASEIGFDAGPEHGVVTVECDAASVPLLSGYRPSAPRRVRGTERVRMDVAIGSDAAVRRILAEVPGAVVVGPPAAREAVRAWAREALSRYGRRAE